MEGVKTIFDCMLTFFSNKKLKGSKNQQQQKKLFLRGNFRPLPNKNVQMLDHFFPFLFPKDSVSVKILDIRLWEVVAKRPLTGTSKVNTHTNRRTDGQTGRRTNRLIESIGPEGRCFEKIGGGVMEVQSCLFHQLGPSDRLGPSWQSRSVNRNVHTSASMSLI